MAGRYFTSTNKKRILQNEKDKSRNKKIQKKKKKKESKIFFCFI
jgi:hypothetical protein